MSCPSHALAESRRMLMREDVDLIRQLAATLDPEPMVVDLGAGSGTTAAAVFAERPAAFVTTFDINADNVNWARQFIETSHPEATMWIGQVMDSAAAARIFADASVDLLLVDSSHEYDHTVAEIDAWLPKLGPGALVWFHDYAGMYPGVTRAVDEAVAVGKFELIEARGLGWAGRKA